MLIILQFQKCYLRKRLFFFTQKLNISRDKISFSNGWIEKFKKQNNIHSYHFHGEANSVSLEILSEERKKLQKILQDYTLDNIFNADETGFFFRMIPNKTLASALTPGTKQITQSFTLNWSFIIVFLKF